MNPFSDSMADTTEDLSQYCLIGKNVGNDNRIENGRLENTGIWYFVPTHFGRQKHLQCISSIGI